MCELLSFEIASDFFLIGVLVNKHHTHLNTLYMHTRERKCLVGVLITLSHIRLEKKSFIIQSHDSHTQRGEKRYLMVMLMMLTSSYGLSVFGLTLTLEILCTTSIPFVVRPNTVCLLSSHGCEGETPIRMFKSTVCFKSGINILLIH